ncbi:MAG: endospore coat-associated protein [Cohnella sp.]|nr:endospore coat-associated protein [Cohnella sp.]
MIGRVAHPAKIVTNYHSGGKPTGIRTLLRPYVKNKGLPEYTNILARVGTTAAAVLGHAYPGVNMVGADIGVDRGLKPWIIELTRTRILIFSGI